MEKYNVLVVDDEIMIRRGLAEIIKWNEIGYELSGAVGTAAEALAILQKTRVHVLLTDISMPEMTGLELIRRAKELHPRMKTVVISGYSEFDYAMEAIKLKVENYILKPLDPQKITEIFEHLREVLDEEQKNQKREQYLRSEYELRRSSETGHCDFQTELIRKMEEGKNSEIDTLVEEMFRAAADGDKMNEICLKILRNSVLYFRLENPPYFQIYRLSENEEQDKERVKTCFQSDIRMILSCLREHSESTVLLISRRAKLYIDGHYEDKNLSLRQVASELGVSYGYLSTAFAKTYGENFKSYLANVRAEHARELLMERKYKIYEIADRTGYGSSRYFTDAFKRRYGISPVDYLNRMNRGNGASKG